MLFPNCILSMYARTFLILLLQTLHRVGSTEENRAYESQEDRGQINLATTIGKIGQVGHIPSLFSSSPSSHLLHISCSVAPVLWQPAEITNIVNENGLQETEIAYNILTFKLKRLFSIARDMFVAGTRWSGFAKETKIQNEFKTKMSKRSSFVQILKLQPCKLTSHTVRQIGVCLYLCLTSA